MDSFDDRNKQDYEYWRQSKFIRGEASDVYASEGLASLGLIVMALIAIPVVKILKAAGMERPGAVTAIVTLGIFICLFGKIIHRVVSQMRP